MKNLEFYIYDSELWCIRDDGRNDKVTEQDTDLISDLLSVIREQYPDAYQALSDYYKKSALNVSYYQYLMIRRFVKCNFGLLDNTQKDVDLFGKLHFERVPCPLRGECPLEGVVCCPKFNTKISEAELRVMRLYYQGYDKQEIASQLYLSAYTVKNHILSVYKKLGIHEKAEFIKYANDHQLFTEQ